MWTFCNISSKTRTLTPETVILVHRTTCFWLIAMTWKVTYTWEIMVTLCNQRGQVCCRSFITTTSGILPVGLFQRPLAHPLWQAFVCPLHWRHNDHDGVSNHQPHGCLLNRLFRCRSKKTPKLRVTGLCVGNSPGPVNSPHKGPVTRKMFPFDDVIMHYGCAIGLSMTSE